VFRSRQFLNALLVALLCSKMRVLKVGVDVLRGCEGELLQEDGVEVDAATDGVAAGAVTVVNEDSMAEGDRPCLLCCTAPTGGASARKPTTIAVTTVGVRL